jgi:hypothetical protein
MREEGNSGGTDETDPLAGDVHGATEDKRNDVRMNCREEV